MNKNKLFDWDKEIIRNNLLNSITCLIHSIYLNDEEKIEYILREHFIGKNQELLTHFPYDRPNALKVFKRMKNKHDAVITVIEELSKHVSKRILIDEILVLMQKEIKYIDISTNDLNEIKSSLKFMITELYSSQMNNIN